MTEDTSPENLRKFLESDDPAMVRMGLSMAKGSGVPDEMLGLVAGLYMWHGEASIRRGAKGVFFDYAVDDLKNLIKANWDTKYRTLKMPKKLGPLVSNLINAFNNTPLNTIDLWKHAIIRNIEAEANHPSETIIPLISDYFGEKSIDLLIMAFNEDTYGTPSANALTKIGKAAIEPLIPILNSNNKWKARRDALNTICAISIKHSIDNSELTKNLVETLNDKDTYLQELTSAALGSLADKRATTPLMDYINNNNIDDFDNFLDYQTLQTQAISALGNIQNPESTEFLISKLKEYNEKSNSSRGIRCPSRRDVTDVGYTRYLCLTLMSSLALIGDPQSIEIIEKTTDDLLKVYNKKIKPGDWITESKYHMTDETIRTISAKSIEIINEKVLANQNKHNVENILKNKKKINESDHKEIFTYILSNPNNQQIEKIIDKIGFNKIIHSIDEGTLAGAAIWYDIDAKKRDLISKKLIVNPEEMIAEHWMKQNAQNTRIDMDSILSNEGYFVYYWGPHLELCKAKMKCRQCQKKIMKGELRFSTETDISGGRYTSKYHFCRECTTHLIKPSVRYRIIEKWWYLLNGWIELAKAVENKDAAFIIDMLDDGKRKSYRWGTTYNGEWLGFEVDSFQTLTNQEIRTYIIEKLGTLGDKKALLPLIEIIDENDLDIVAVSLSKIVKKHKLENNKEILKFLKGSDKAMKRMGASMLKGVLEK